MATRLKGRSNRSSRKQSHHYRASSNEAARARMVDAFLARLAATPGGQYEEILTHAEMKEAIAMMRALIGKVRASLVNQELAGKHPIPPATFRWCGKRHRLLYSSAGRVFIANRGGQRLLASDFFALW